MLRARGGRLEVPARQVGGEATPKRRVLESAGIAISRIFGRMLAVLDEQGARLAIAAGRFC
jgi:hypothetical protein